MTLKTVIQLTACLVVATAFAANAQDKKVEPVGTWKWTATMGRGQGQGQGQAQAPEGQGQQRPGREVTLKIKSEAGKLVGTVSMMGRQNNTPTETPVKEITLKGDEITFEVVREFGGNTMTQKYVGKLDGDTIKGKIESKRGDGEARTTDWEAKREVAKPEVKPAP